jgi:hypothetical protein
MDARFEGTARWLAIECSHQTERRWAQYLSQAAIGSPGGRPVAAISTIYRHSINNDLATRH